MFKLTNLQEKHYYILPTPRLCKYDGFLFINTRFDHNKANFLIILLLNFWPLSDCKLRGVPKFKSISSNIKVLLQIFFKWLKNVKY